MNQKSIYLVEDHPIFRLGLKEIISQEEDLFVCGEAEEVEKALEGIEELRPDLAIVDISLKGKDGIDLIAEINRLYTNIKVLVISMYEEELYAVTALKAGASGYIMKQHATENVINAIRAILAGRIFLSDKMIGEILENAVGKTTGAKKDPISLLSNREMEVFRLIGEGVATRDIANRLNLSSKTIGTHRERIKEKLQLKSGAELTSCAVRWMSGRKP